MIGVFAALVGFLIARAKYRSGPGSSDVATRPQALTGSSLGWTQLFDRVYQDVFVRGFAAWFCGR